LRLSGKVGFDFRTVPEISMAPHLRGCAGVGNVFEPSTTKSGSWTWSLQVLHSFGKEDPVGDYLEIPRRLGPQTELCHTDCIEGRSSGCSTGLSVRELRSSRHLCSHHYSGQQLRRSKQRQEVDPEGSCWQKKLAGSESSIAMMPSSIPISLLMQPCASKFKTC
jgi:hypothetical protein